RRRRIGADDGDELALDRLSRSDADERAADEETVALPLRAFSFAQDMPGHRAMLACADLAVEDVPDDAGDDTADERDREGHAHQNAGAHHVERPDLKGRRKE